MIIWFAMFPAIFVYLIVCYYILLEGTYKPTYSVEILQNNLFMNLNIYTTIYIFATTVCIAGYLNFKRNYSKIVTDTINEDFESINILGIIVFLLTFDVKTLPILVILTIFGFILVMPSKSKFNYQKERMYFS